MSALKYLVYFKIQVCMVLKKLFSKNIVRYSARVFPPDFNHLRSHKSDSAALARSFFAAQRTKFDALDVITAQ